MKQPCGAIFDESGHYRYRLWRRWNASLPKLCFVMLNPSTADATSNDPTIARCVNMATRWGYGGIEVVNLFAYRSTRPRDLWGVDDPIGANNDVYIKRSSARAEACLLAWGNLPASKIERSRAVLKILQKSNLYCLGLTKLNQPRHPLYLRADVLLEQLSLDKLV